LKCGKKMEKANRSRWGVVALAIVMLVVTMVNTSLNGQQNSFYYAVWTFIAWYGYKGNLEQIKSWMKFLIVANILVMLWIVMFIEDDVTNLVIKGETKESMAIGILVMLIPKFFLYIYCNKEINKNSESRLSSTSHFEYEGINSQYQTNQQYKNLTDDELLTEAVLGDEKSQFKIGQQYWLGEKRIRDATVAYAWLRIAKESGSEAARFYLDNTVFKQLHQQDIDNSIKLHESLKQAIERRDVNFCELLIRKSLDDRNIIQDSNNEIEINFSLSTQEYKEKYGINDYDFAKAINEMNGLLQDSPKNNELMSACQASTSSFKQAEKKYIYTRAYEISKSLDRDAPTYLKPQPIFKSSSTNLIYDKLERDREEVEKIRNITKEPQWMKVTYIASYILMGISLLGLIAYSFTPRQTTQSEISNQKTEIKEIKVVDDVMSYRISECSRVDSDELIIESVFEKIKINYSTNTITTFPPESQNQSMQVVNYEDCSLKDEKKSCLKLIDEKTKSHIKFDVNNNLFINEIISETDGNEAIKVKWACISSPINDM
jgi:hypothetical protein